MLCEVEFVCGAWTKTLAKALQQASSQIKATAAIFMQNRDLAAARQCQSMQKVNALGKPLST